MKISKRKPGLLTGQIVVQLEKCRPDRLIRHFVARTLCFLVGMQPAITHANACETLNGHWRGFWQQQNFRHVTQLDITVKHQHFKGRFKIARHAPGTFAGACQQINENEVYLTLNPDPPWYNPCRGVLMAQHPHARLHLFCFHPNEQGFFDKHHAGSKRSGLRLVFPAT